MMAGMRPCLTAFLSTLLLHGVSAGGAYCAEKARARAAALGLEYPGEHGAPDLSPLADYEMPHHAGNIYDPRHENTELYQQPKSLIESGFEDSDHTLAAVERFKELNPSRGTPVKPGQIQRTTIQMLWIPRGKRVNHRKSVLEKVRHVAARKLDDTPWNFDLVKWNPEGINNPMPFSDSEHDLDYDDDDNDDEYAPDRYSVASSGLSSPLSKSPNPSHLGVPRHGWGRKAPVLGSARLVNKLKKSRGPAFNSWEGSRFPTRPALYLQKSFNVKPFAQGYPILRRHTSPQKKFS